MVNVPWNPVLGAGFYMVGDWTFFVSENNQTIQKGKALKRKPKGSNNFHSWFQLEVFAKFRIDSKLVLAVAKLGKENKIFPGTYRIMQLHLVFSIVRQEWVRCWGLSMPMIQNTSFDGLEFAAFRVNLGADRHRQRLCTWPGSDKPGKTDDVPATGPAVRHVVTLLSALVCNPGIFIK